MSDPRIKKHIERWKQTRSFLNKIDPGYPEWSVTVAFYAALHGVQAMLLQRGHAPESHTDRKWALNRLGHSATGSSKRTLRDLGSWYESLREASNHCRYQPEVTEYCDTASVQSRIVDDLLADIERTLRKLLGSSAVGALTPIRLPLSADEAGGSAT